MSDYSKQQCVGVHGISQIKAPATRESTKYWTGPEIMTKIKMVGTHWTLFVPLWEWTWRHNASLQFAREVIT